MRKHQMSPIIHSLLIIMSVLWGWLTFLNIMSKQVEQKLKARLQKKSLVWF
ncbi:hypothetical protein EJD97_025012 [Solanum chilense]|uniref:Uncharacterized protein n=1 Tax=Solanum chilense TaxID=4083 RepID=A0A6N2C8J2_SOLCI|nr:hypothetical protein EJD97_025012 [Solanum chilense]